MTGTVSTKGKAAEDKVKEMRGLKGLMDTARTLVLL